HDVVADGVGGAANFARGGGNRESRRQAGGAPRVWRLAAGRLPERGVGLAGNRSRQRGCDAGERAVNREERGRALERIGSPDGNGYAGAGGGEEIRGDSGDQ